jgi:hypothetical protein
MATLDSHQVAELVVGIARAQQAIIEAIESSKAGFRSTHLMPALTNAARVRDTRRPLQLADVPARVLLQCLGRLGPDVDQVARDIEALLAPGRAQP